MVLFTAAISGLICLTSAWLAATEPDGRTGNVAIALFTGSVSLMMSSSLAPEPGAWSTTELDGRPAWRLRLGPGRRATLVVTAVLATTGAVLVLLAVGAASRSVPAAVVLALLAVVMLLLAVEMGRVAARSPALLVGVDRLHHQGAGIDVDLTWADVATVEWAHLGTRRASLRIGAVVGATGVRTRARSSLIPLDVVPHEPGIELRTRLLGDGPSLLRLLRELHVGGRATRETLMARGTPEVSGR